MLSNEEQEVASLLRAKGYNDAAIAGIMANIDVETGGSFDYGQKQYKGNGYGLFQFDFLKPYYEEYLKDEKKKDSAEAQIDFMHETIYGKKKDLIGAGTAKQLQKALESETSDGVAYVFMDKWERPGVPHQDRRLNSAVKYESLLGGDAEVISDTELQGGKSWQDELFGTNVVNAWKNLF